MTNVTNVVVSPTLTMSVPSTATNGVPISPSSIAAVLAGSSGATTGAITYYVIASACAPATCPGAMTSFGSSSPSADGSWSPAVGYTPTSTTKLWWYASFAGDALDNPAKTTCGAGMASTTVTPPGPDTFVLSNIGTQIAGASFTVTLTATLSAGGTDTAYTGVKTIVFTGPANAPDGTAPVYPGIVTFTNGVGTASIKLFKAGSTTLTATQGLDLQNVGFVHRQRWHRVGALHSSGAELHRIHHQPGQERHLHLEGRAH